MTQSMPCVQALRLPRLEYVSVQNQGDFLVEVPAEREDVPQVLSRQSQAHASCQ